MGLAKDSSVLTSVLSRKGKHPSDEAAASERPGASAAHGPGGGAPGKVVSKREREAERERIREEWKKMIWWEVLYYDLCVSFCFASYSWVRYRGVCVHVLFSCRPGSRQMLWDTSPISRRTCLA